MSVLGGEYVLGGRNIQGRQVSMSEGGGYPGGGYSTPRHFP